MPRIPEKRGGGSREGGKSDSHRNARVEREIRDVIGAFLLGGLRGDIPGFVSLTRVIVSNDLRIARCHVTLLTTQNEGETPEAFAKRQAEERKDAVRVLNMHDGEIQHRLAKVLQMRFTPKVTFYYDEGYDSAMKVEQILREMSEKGRKSESSADGSGDPVEET